MKYHLDFDSALGSVGGFEVIAESSFLISRLMKGVHNAIVQECGAQASRQDTIAVAFPLAVTDSHGAVLRVFSNDRSVLERLSRHPGIYRFASEMQLEIKESPSTNKRVAYMRNRSIDKLAPSSIRRAKLRAAVFGEKEASRSKATHEVFSIEMQSDSNSNSPFFHLRIKTLKKEIQSEGLFNSYGLSVTGGDLPDF